MSGLWTDRDLDIVETLTRRVRLLTLEQVAGIWWPDAVTLRVVRRRLRKLADAGLIERRVINIGVRPTPLTPLVGWSPGDDVPNADQISRLARSRWIRGTVSRELVSATKLAANLFGSTLTGLPPVHHRDHDLLLSDVYAHYRKAKPVPASDWRNADSLPGDRNLPRADAFLVDAEQTVIRAIKSAGRAKPKVISTFHVRLANANLAYELW